MYTLCILLLVYAYQAALKFFLPYVLYQSPPLQKNSTYVHGTKPHYHHGTHISQQHAGTRNPHGIWKIHHISIIIDALKHPVWTILPWLQYIVGTNCTRNTITKSHSLNTFTHLCLFVAASYSALVCSSLILTSVSQHVLLLPYSHLLQLHHGFES